MKKIILFITSILFLTMLGTNLAYANNYGLNGYGTKNNPYTISTKEDLYQLADLVNNKGIDFKNEWFLQTKDIDLEDTEFTPIGITDSGKYFYGIYDGNGHTIKNINIIRDDNVGFFGQLGGICMNLGIESGYIHGNCCGSISSHSASQNALIFNCYNKAIINGARAGGIADNFNGTIINCWSDCKLSGDLVGGIVSYSAFKIINCYSTCDLFSENKHLGQNCYKVNEINTINNYNILNLFCFKKVNNKISYKDVNKWELNNNKLYLGDKQNFNFKNYVISNKVNIIPYFILIISSIAILINVLRKKEKKTNKKYK